METDWNMEYIEVGRNPNYGKIDELISHLSKNREKNMIKSPQQKYFKSFIELVWWCEDFYLTLHHQTNNNNYDTERRIKRIFRFNGLKGFKG